MTPKTCKKNSSYLPCHTKDFEKVPGLLSCHIYHILYYSNSSKALLGVHKYTRHKHISFDFMPLIILVLFISMPRIMSEIRYKCLLNKLVNEWLKVSLLRKLFTYLFIWLILCCPVAKHVWILQSLNSNLHIFSRESYLKSTEICTSSPHPSSYLSHLSALSTFSQFSSVVQSCLTLCDPMDCSTPGLPVHHQLPEFTQTHVHWVGDTIQPSYPLTSPSPPAFNLSQRQGLFKWVSSLHQVAKVLELQLQHQSFQWSLRTDFFSDELVGSPCCPRDS